MQNKFEKEIVEFLQPLYDDYVKAYNEKTLSNEAFVYFNDEYKKMLQINPQNQLTMSDESAFNMIEAELNYFYDKFEKMDILREKFPVIQKEQESINSDKLQENEGKLSKYSTIESLPNLNEKFRADSAYFLMLVKTLEMEKLGFSSKEMNLKLKNDFIVFEKIIENKIYDGVDYEYAQNSFNDLKETINNKEKSYINKNR